MLRVLDYSRVSRHLLVTAGDDGTVHLWDTTGRNPKVCHMLNYKLYTILQNSTIFDLDDS
jgi:WD40 repeat protein